MKAYDEEASRSLAIEHCNRKFAALDAEAREGVRAGLDLAEGAALVAETCEGA